MTNTFLSHHREDATCFALQACKFAGSRDNGSCDSKTESSLDTDQRRFFFQNLGQHGIPMHSGHNHCMLQTKTSLVPSLCLVHRCAYLNSQYSPVTHCKNFARGKISPLFLTAKFSPRNSPLPKPPPPTVFIVCARDGERVPSVVCAQEGAIFCFRRGGGVLYIVCTREGAQYNQYNCAQKSAVYRLYGGCNLSFLHGRVLYISCAQKSATHRLCTGGCYTSFLCGRAHNLLIVHRCDH